LHWEHAIDESSRSLLLTVGNAARPFMI